MVEGAGNSREERAGSALMAAAMCIAGENGKDTREGEGIKGGEKVGGDGGEERVKGGGVKGGGKRKAGERGGEG